MPLHVTGQRRHRYSLVLPVHPRDDLRQMRLHLRQRHTRLDSHNQGYSKAAIGHGLSIQGDWHVRCQSPPAGDGEVLERVRQRRIEVETRSAGASTLVNGTVREDQTHP